jgi:hypothetical protein
MYFVCTSSLAALHRVSKELSLPNIEPGYQQALKPNMAGVRALQEDMVHRIFFLQTSEVVV